MHCSISSSIACVKGCQEWRSRHSRRSVAEAAVLLHRPSPAAPRMAASATMHQPPGMLSRVPSRQPCLRLLTLEHSCGTRGRRHSPRLTTTARVVSWMSSRPNEYLQAANSACLPSALWAKSKLLHPALGCHRFHPHSHPAPLLPPLPPASHVCRVGAALAQQLLGGCRMGRRAGDARHTRSADVTCAGGQRI